MLCHWMSHCFPAVCLCPRMDWRVLSICRRCLSDKTKQLFKWGHVHYNESAIVSPTVHLQMPPWLHRWDNFALLSILFCRQGISKCGLINRNVGYGARRTDGYFGKIWRAPGLDRFSMCYWQFAGLFSVLTLICFVVALYAQCNATKAEKPVIFLTFSSFNTVSQQSACSTFDSPCWEPSINYSHFHSAFSWFEERWKS